MPIQVESQDHAGTIEGEVYGILDQPFTAFSSALQQLPLWCDLATLHFNIKACTYRSRNGNGALAIYAGSKHYQDPKQARQYEFIYTTRAASADYLDILITSTDGPLDTYGYRLEISATPLAGRTFVRVLFAYRYRLLTRMLSATYYETVGRSKIGFSVTGADQAGNPIYVKGRAGAMERNVMRYYLGLQALLESLTRPEADRFEWRIGRWYQLTEHYRRQLYELDEGEYLQAKRRERVNQLHLQIAE